MCVRVGVAALPITFLLSQATTNDLTSPEDSKEVACVCGCLWVGVAAEQGRLARVRAQVCACGSSLPHCQSSFAVTGGYQ